MSQFYSDKELGVAYSWISAAQSISSVWACLSAWSSPLSRALFCAMSGVPIFLCRLHTLFILS